MGEGHSPRWGLLGLALAVLVLGVGGWQLVFRPDAPATPATAATAASDDGSARSLVSDALPRLRRDDTRTGPSVRLGSRTVTLSGPGLTRAERETSARAVGRLDRGWLVAVTSTACEDSADVQVSYGTARSSGRFTAWDAVRTQRGTTWRSPDRTVRLVQEGPRLEVRRIPTGRVVFDFGSGA